VRSRPVISRFFITLLLQALPLVVSGDPVYIGLQTHTWHDLWEHHVPDGNTEVRGFSSDKRRIVAAENLLKYRELGARWNVVHVYQERDSEREIKRLQRVLDKHRENGIDVVFRLYEDPDIYSDVLDAADSEYGYHEQYFNWVTRLAREFGDEVDTWLISNEIDHDLRFNTIDRRKPPHQYYIEYEDYRKILDTAYAAIKQVNTKLVVADHGISSTSLALAVADQMIREGNPRLAHDFWKIFRNNQGLYAKSFPHFLKLFGSPHWRRKINIARTSFNRPGKCDAFQLHFYGNWQALPEILDWIRKTAGNAGTERPVLATEVGYIMPWREAVDTDGKTYKQRDDTRFSEQEHAESLVKTLSILTGSGIGMLQYWQMRFHHDRAIVARLFHAPDKAGEFRPLKAALAFQTLTHQLNSLVADVDRLESTGLTEFAYSGETQISVVWSDTGTSIPAKTLESIEQVIDMYGTPLSIDKGESLPVNERPLYLQWKAAPTTTSRICHEPSSC
jgi:hypothetical protein